MRVGANEDLSKLFSEADVVGNLVSAVWGCLTYPRSPAETYRDTSGSRGRLIAL